MKSRLSLNCLALSDSIRRGVPLLDANRLNAIKNLAVVASVTISRWTARIVRHVNITPYVLRSSFDPSDRTRKGPKKSIPMKENGVSERILSGINAGSSASLHGFASNR